MKRVLVLGGTGFLGTYLLNRLARERIAARVLSRNPAASSSPRVAPGVEFCRADVFDPGVLARQLADCDAAVNLVGILNESGRDGSGFHRAHVELVEKLIDACRQAGVSRLLQMSAIGAGQGRSHYQQSKGEAEARIRESGLDWTLLRPSVVFGPQDSFLNRFAMLLKLSPVLPLACHDARFQPVYAGDVSGAMLRCLQQRWTIGETFELAGPHVYTLKQLVTYVRDLLELRRLIIGLPDPLARVQASVFDFVPGKPFSTDNYLSAQQDNVSDREDLQRLGIEPTPLEAIAPRYLGKRASVSHRGAVHH